MEMPKKQTDMRFHKSTKVSLINLKGKSENSLSFQTRNTCIVVKIDHGFHSEPHLAPFGFHIELNREKYLRRRHEIRREKITRLLHWFVIFHHNFGIRHVILVLLLACYSLIGGYVFNAIESPQEIMVSDRPSKKKRNYEKQWCSIFACQ
ncbi:unnamed protein product [Toxocara canis]|uniref:Uncharacterized protein n=1 Tax=Toxocara canis TaxID=6265 RepID=A0A183TX90_TOXCA|nr:unnamed protein product [Toxocara canis]